MTAKIKIIDTVKILAIKLSNGLKLPKPRNGPKNQKNKLKIIATNIVNAVGEARELIIFENDIINLTSIKLFQFFYFLPGLL